MKRLFIGLLLGLLLGQLSLTSAQHRAPVQVNVRDGEVEYYFDCEPDKPADFNPDEDYMAVYLDYPDGLALYICNYAQGAYILPLPPADVLRMARNEVHQ